MTGIRLKPLRRASDMAWRSVLWRSMKTTSVRGTITSRTIVSPSSKTEWIIARSPDSMTWLASARSTSSRSSASEENGPSLKPRPGVMMLPRTISSCGSGPSTRVKSDDHRGRRAARHAGRGAARPCAGPTPTATNCTTSMTPTDDEDPEPAGRSTIASTTSATSTIAAISQSMPQEQRGVEVARRGPRRSSAAGGRRRRPSSSSSSARTLETTPARRRRWRRSRPDQEQRPRRPPARVGRAHDGALAAGGVAGRRPHALPLASSRACRPNISACSSGSAWS